MVSFPPKNLYPDGRRRLSRTVVKVKKIWLNSFDYNIRKFSSDRFKSKPINEVLACTSECENN